MKKYLLMKEEGGSVLDVANVWAVDYCDALRKFSVLKKSLYITPEMEKYYWITGGGI